MKTTPNLANEFHPIPKPTKKEKTRPTGLKQVGKKTQEWADIREELKAKFKADGITSCEIHLDTICWKKNALTFAHTDKRRKLSKEDLYKVVLACTPCHMEVEKWPALEMKRFLLKIITERQGVI